MQVNNVSQLFDKTIQSTELSSKQKLVLKESLNLFSEQGFDHTTSSEIAAAAGVAEGTVFKTFKTKRGILNALLQPFLEKIIPIVASEFISEIKNNKFDDFGTFLNYAITDRMTFAANNQKQLRIFLQEIVRNPSAGEILSAKWQQVLNGSLGQLLSRFKTSGQIVNWPNERISRYVISVVASYIVPDVMFGTSEITDINLKSQEATEFLLRGLSTSK